MIKKAYKGDVIKITPTTKTRSGFEKKHLRLAPEGGSWFSMQVHTYMYKALEGINEGDKVEVLVEINSTPTAPDQANVVLRRIKLQP